MDVSFFNNNKSILTAIATGAVKDDDTFFTAINLSLFNGDCFYNIYTKNKTDNSFIEALFAPINVNNLQNAQTKAENLLRWLIDAGAAKSIEVFAYGGKNQKINADISITEPDFKISKYSVLWDNERIYLGKQNG